MSTSPDIDVADEPSAEPLYLVEPHEGGGIVIRLHDDPLAGGVNLFSLDQLQAIIAERLPQGYPLVLGGDL
jgi:hypothetical protein